MKKYTFKKLASLVLAGVMVCGLVAANAGAAEPASVSAKSVNELAYMDLEGATPELREDILSARAQIVYSTSWTVDGAMSIVHKDGTVEALPEFSDLFPGWDLTEISSFEADPPCDGIRVASSDSIYFQDNVWLLPYDNSATTPFYKFNASGNTVYAWAHRFSSNMSTSCNIGFTNMDTGRDLGWTLGVEKDEQISLSTRANVRYGVRASAPTGGTAGNAFMVVSEDPNVDISFQG